MSFENATRSMVVTPGENLYAYVYLDPLHMPAEVMSQWKAGGTWRRAYWGDNDITSFTNIESDDSGGTTVRIGNLPTQSGWVRLQVLASQVGITSSTTVSGLSLDSYGGQAAWDDIGPAVVPITPIALWPLNEGNGTIAHDIIGGNDGTLVGNANWRPTGVSAGDFNFDGSTYFDARLLHDLEPGGNRGQFNVHRRMVQSLQQCGHSGHRD